MRSGSAERRFEYLTLFVITLNALWIGCGASHRDVNKCEVVKSKIKRKPAEKLIFEKIVF